ncbi:MAG: cytochrome-c peroxidase [Planctomycetota bacterium]
MKTGTLLLTFSLSFAFAACGGGDSKPSGAGKSAGGDSAANSAKSGGDSAAKTSPKGSATTKPKKRVRRPKINMTMVKALMANETTAPEAPVASSEALVALGNKLYHWDGLSADGSMSCASCHDLSNYGVDGKKTSGMAHGAAFARNTPTTYNAHRQYAQFWDARGQAVEHGLKDAAGVVEKCKGEASVAEMFGKAFAGQDEAVTADNAGIAIGAFVRTLVTRSKWDDFLDGNKKALSNEELVGLNKFMEVGCTTCHMNRALGGSLAQKLGVHTPYTGEDTGRMKMTGAETDKYMFKVPTLLNVEKTAPYYHDGSYATLEEAVKHMAKVQLAKDLKDEEVASIVTFLKALTGPLPEAFAKK